MFSKLFKPRWQHRDPRSRLAVVRDLTAENDAELLMQLAGDDDLGVRKAALAKLPLKNLMALPASSFDNDWTDTVLQAIQHGQMTTELRQQLATAHPQLPLTQWFVEYHPAYDDVAEEIKQLMARQSPPTSTLLKWLKKSPHHLLATRIIEAISDSDALQSLLKTPDAFDKRCNQLLRERLRHLKVQERSQQAQQEQIDKCLLRVQQLAASSVYPLYHAEVQHVEQQWLALGQVPDRFITQFGDALSRCQQKLAETPRTQIPPPAVVPETSIVPEPSPVSAALDTETTAETAVKTNDAHAKRTAAFARQFDQLATRVEEALSQHDRKLSNDCFHALRQHVRENADKTPARLLARLQHLQAQLNELDNWQAFAVLPKMEALCQSMQQLNAAPLPPKEQADAIHALQLEWKQLRAPKSDRVQALWVEFKQAGDLAYAPCNDFFAKEKNLRSHNLAQRVAICEALEKYNEQDWSKVDWRAVDKVIQVALKEFANFHPIDRSDEKTIKERFNAALRPIKDHLQAEFRRVETEKGKLIDKARQLLDEHNRTDAAKKMQLLQQDWKLVGNGKHHRDQELWKQFSALGNQVFDLRREFFAQKDAEAEHALEEAVKLQRAVTELTARHDDNVNVIRQELQHLKAQFDALTVNDKKHAAIHKQFRDACVAAQRFIDDAPVRDKRKAQQLLAELADICQQLETSNDKNLIDSLQQQWDQKPAGVSKQKMLERFQHALKVATGEADISFADIADERRHLCIVMEIMLGIDSPAADQELRRQIQLNSLSRKFGGQTEQAKTLEDLQLKWWQLPSAEPAIQAQLNLRWASLNR